MIQHVNMPTGIPTPRSPDRYLSRVATHLSPLTERYQALRGTNYSFERAHRHARQRYSANGNDTTIKLKRAGLQVHRLRNALARFVEWFRIGLRHGWIAGHKKLNDNAVHYRRGN